MQSQPTSAESSGAWAPGALSIEELERLAAEIRPSWEMGLHNARAEMDGPSVQVDPDLLVPSPTGFEASTPNTTEDLAALEGNHEAPVYVHAAAVAVPAGFVSPPAPTYSARHDDDEPLTVPVTSSRRGMMIGVGLGAAALIGIVAVMSRSSAPPAQPPVQTLRSAPVPVPSTPPSTTTTTSTTAVTNTPPSVQAPPSVPVTTPVESAPPVVVPPPPTVAETAPTTPVVAAPVATTTTATPPPIERVKPVVTAAATTTTTTARSANTGATVTARPAGTLATTTPRTTTTPRPATTVATPRATTTSATSVTRPATTSTTARTNPTPRATTPRTTTPSGVGFVSDSPY